MSEASAYTMVQLMQGVVKFGTAVRLTLIISLFTKAGKQALPMITPMVGLLVILPNYWQAPVGCEDPFIRIYSGTSGGNEMAAPKWAFL